MLGQNCARSGEEISCRHSVTYGSMSSAFNKYTAYVTISVFLLAGAILAFVADGTSGAGDSSMHYLFARYAPSHPKLFFHHWAKPLFVLITCPAAQFGITGMKLFNLVLSAVTMYVAWRVALRFKSSMQVWFRCSWLLVRLSSTIRYPAILSRSLALLRCWAHCFT
jgi:hypothetical protein